MKRRCIPLSDNPDAQVDRLVAEGVLAEGDADAVHDFAEFLRDSATDRAAEDDVGARRVSTWVLWKHRELCGLTDNEVRDVARQRGEPDPEPGAVS